MGFDCRSRLLDGETIITSIIPTDDGLYLLGSRRIHNYKIIVIKTNRSFEIEWERTYGLDNSDSEGHSGALADGGVLICGCSGGKATPEGGRDWKAHAMKITSVGDIIWERAIQITGNDCAYNISSHRGAFLFGEARSPRGCGFFVSSLDGGGDVEWSRDYGNFEDVMAGGIVGMKEGLLCSGSMKTADGWHSMLFGTSLGGHIEWERDLGSELIFQMRDAGDGAALVGEISGLASVVKTDYTGNILWKTDLGRGSAISLVSNDSEILVGGENGEGAPFVCQLDSEGRVLRRIDLDGTGWVEAIAGWGKSVAVAIHSMEPEKTEIMLIEIKR